MKWHQRGGYLTLLWLVSGFLFSCSGSGNAATVTEGTAVQTEATDHAHTPGQAEAGELELPAVQPVDLQGSKLRVVATTSIIGDVVAQVGGEAIDLTTLMAPGQDPHSYQPGAQELTAVAQAHVIFVNGWDLEEALSGDLATIGETVPIIPVSAHITPLAIGDEAENHDHAGVDPHVWFSVTNVEQWVENITHTLSDLDPANAQVYENNAAAYLVQLAELGKYIETSLAAIPAANRFLVTNHGAFGYLAQTYNLEIASTVIPGFSTLAEPSASDLTELISVMQEHQVCTIFTETTVSDQLARVVAEELNFCATVQFLPLYTGSLGPTGSGTDSYLGLMRTNVDAIVAGLQ